MQRWVRDFVLLPLGVGVVLAVVTLLLPLLLRDKHELSYQIRSTQNLISDQQFAPHVQLLLDGKPVDKAFSYGIRIWNSGDVPLKDLGVTLALKETPTQLEPKFLTPLEHKTVPSKEFGAIDALPSPGPAEVRVKYALLNSGDEDNVTFLSNRDVEVGVYAKAEGVQVNEVKRTGSERELFGGPLFGFIVSFVGMLVAVVASLVVKRK